MILQKFNELELLLLLASISPIPKDLKGNVLLNPRYKNCGVTCSNQLAVKFCCSQSRSSILHRRHHLFYKIIWLNLKTQTFHQSWSTSWGTLWTVSTMKENHTKDTIQNSKTEIGVIWKAKHTFQFQYTKVFTSFPLNVL